jgi:hypothetical protein
VTAKKITENERQVLNALRDGQVRSPHQMRVRFPGLLGKRSDAGLHRTAASLCRKGLAERVGKESGVAYRITAAGRTAANEANRRRQCLACDYPDRHSRHTCGLKKLQAMLALPGPRR